MNTRQLSFKGTHRQIGEQVGKQYKEWGKKEVALPPLVSDYYPKQLAIYEKYYPQYLEYLKGISIGLGIDEDRILQSHLTGFLSIAWEKPTNKCSVFVLKNSNGVFIGRNYDWRESSEKNSRKIDFEFTDNSSNNFVGVSDMGTWEEGVTVGSEKFVLSIDEAWNSKGLYVAINGAPGQKREVGMSTPHLVQLVAEQTDTVDQAVDLISQVPIPESKIFTVADKNGKMAVVEKSIEKGTRVRESDGLIIATNHFNHPDLLSENIQLFKDVPFHSTFARYHYLQYNLEKDFDDIDLDKISSLMTKPPVLQNWRGKKMGDVVTVWTTALDLVSQNYKVIFSPLAESEQIEK